MQLSLAIPPWVDTEYAYGRKAIDALQLGEKEGIFSSGIFSYHDEFLVFLANDVSCVNRFSCRALLIIVLVRPNLS